QVDQQAGLAPGPGMEDVGGFTRVAHVSAWRRASPARSVAVAEGAQRGLVVGPALAHAHPGLQEHLGAEQLLHALARTAADLAQARPALADHDRLLAVALDPDHGADAVHHARPGRGF